MENNVVLTTGHVWVKYLKQLNFKNKASTMRNKICPVCNKVLKKNLANHFNLIRDESHKVFYQEQKNDAVKLFLMFNSPTDIEKVESIFMNKKWIYRRMIEILGYSKFLLISREIIKRKRKNYWNSFSKEERKNRMSVVRHAEWGNLTSEQRKNHPWVIAGRKASLESGIRGSRNQRYAFELLKTKLPDYDWVYNYAINQDWQIDIASPDRKIFIEWDGRHHRIPIHGDNYLNNRKNRDLIKNKIVTEQLKGTMIRVADNGRFDKKFVEEKVDSIVELLIEKIGMNLIHL